MGAPQEHTAHAVGLQEPEKKEQGDPGNQRLRGPQRSSSILSKTPEGSSLLMQGSQRAEERIMLLECCILEAKSFRRLYFTPKHLRAGLGEADKVVWYSHPLKNFLQFFVIHTVKGFGVINKEVDVFLEFSCFFYDPVDVDDLFSILCPGWARQHHSQRDPPFVPSKRLPDWASLELSP